MPMAEAALQIGDKTLLALIEPIDFSGVRPANGLSLGPINGGKLLLMRGNRDQELLDLVD